MLLGDPPSEGGYQPPGFGPAQLILSLCVTGALLAGVAFTGVLQVAERPKARALVVLDLMPPPPPPSAPPPPPAEPRPDTPAPQVETPVVPTPIVRVPAVPMIAVTSPAPSPEPAPAPSTPPRPAPPAMPAPAPPVVADLGDLSASMVSARPPSYPLASRRAREQGTVVISVRLGPDGRVDDASIAHSSGYDRLDQAALEAVRRWRWSPTVRDGAQVEVVGLVRIPFVLRT